MEDDAKKLIARFVAIMRRYEDRQDYLSTTVVQLELLYDDTLNLINPEDLKNHAPDKT